MKRVTFELSDELHKKLKLLCYTESVSIGHILRECVTDFCNKHDAHLIELIDRRSKQSFKRPDLIVLLSVQAAAFFLLEGYADNGFDAFVQLCVYEFCCPVGRFAAIMKRCLASVCDFEMSKSDYISCFLRDFDFYF